MREIEIEKERCSGVLSVTELRGFDDEKSMKNFIALNQTVELAVLFDDVQKASHLGYTLRFNSSRYHFYTSKQFVEKKELRPRSSSISFEERHLLWPLMIALFQNHLAFYNFENETVGVPVSPKIKLFPTPKCVPLLDTHIIFSM